MKVTVQNSFEVLNSILGEQGTIGPEYHLYVARTESGKPMGIGTSYVSCIINTARRVLQPNQKYDMFISGGYNGN